MKSRDGFSKPVVKALADRARNICSNPDCQQPTTGPTSKDPSGVIRLGVAAHITAASPGGPRYKADISPDRRKGIENAIHLCQNCAKLIDSNDGCDYSVELLLKWKESHEASINESLSSPSKARRLAPSLLQPGVNALEAKKRWNMLLEIFSEEKINLLISQITDPRRAPCQKDCPDIKQFVEKKFMPLGADLQEVHAGPVWRANENAKKVLCDFISSKNREYFMSEWLKIGKDLIALGYFK